MVVVVVDKYKYMKYASSEGFFSRKRGKSERLQSLSLRVTHALFLKINTVGDVLAMILPVALTKAGGPVA